MQEEILFSSEDQKIRKYWLFSCIKIPTFYLCTMLVIASPFVLQKEGFMFFVILTSIYALVLAFIYLFYHCAYKKQGTVFLAIILVCLAFTLIISAYNVLISFSEGPWLFGLTLLSTCLQLWQFYLCFMLREINKKVLGIF